MFWSVIYKVSALKKIKYLACLWTRLVLWKKILMFNLFTYRNSSWPLKHKSSGKYSKKQFLCVKDTFIKKIIKWFWQMILSQEFFHHLPLFRWISFTFALSFFLLRCQKSDRKWLGWEGSETFPRWKARRSWLSSVQQTTYLIWQQLALV